MTTQQDLADYQNMLLIRTFEDAAFTLSLEGEIAGSIHLCFGQEAIPVGAARSLAPGDKVISTYRGHGWALAKGSDATFLMTELLQRSGGTNGGRAGSPMLSDPDKGFLGENSIVGAGFPIANGVGLASKYLGKGEVTLVSIGDGAMNQGSVTEAMVFGAAYSLPVIFLCENNRWAEMTASSYINRDEDLSKRAEALGIRSFRVDGNDPDAVADVVDQAAALCRTGQGPVFVEALTHRLRGHYNKDIEHYRPKEDKEQAEAADPLVRLRKSLVAAGVTEVQLQSIETTVKTYIDAVVEAARQSPLPDPATALDHLYGPSAPIVPAPDPAPGAAQEMTYQRAVNEALAAEMRQRPELIQFGEDIGVAGGTFGATRSLQKEFGEQRIFDTPIAEASILGAGIGAAMSGLRPVVEIMWADFLFVAFDQIINQASNVRYINRSKLTAPLTIRMQEGVTPGSCAQHSQSIEAMLAHIPGIKVGLAATAQDAYSMLRAAVADDDPTVVIESRVLYQETGPVDLNAPAQQAGGARFHARGGDVAIVTWGHTLTKALAAAARLRDEDGIQATVLDLRWLRPLDKESIDAAVRAAGGRVVVAHEATLTGGFGGEIASYITEQHFGTLQAPVVRIGTPDVRMPSAPVLQQAVLPQVDDIVAAAKRLVSARAVAAV